MKKHKSSQPLIRPDMSVLDVISNWGSTETIFQKYDQNAGECICCNSLFESLQEIAAKYNIDIELLINDLEMAVTANA